MLLNENQESPRTFLWFQGLGIKEVPVALGPGVDPEVWAETVTSEGGEIHVRHSRGQSANRVCRIARIFEMADDEQEGH